MSSGRTRLAAAGLLAALAAIVPGTATGTGHDHVRPPLPRLGFNGIPAPEDIGRAAAIGATTGRVFVRWAQVEEERGRLDFARVDALYRPLLEAGMPPLLVLTDAPEWARDPAAGCAYGPQVCSFPPAPAFDAEWTNFVSAVAARYPGAIGIEVWNEPNWDRMWAPSPDPARYAQLLWEAARAVEAVAPGLPVVLGGPAPVAPDAVQAMPAPSFLRRVLAAGGVGAFDVLGIHVYPTRLQRSFVGDTARQVEPLIRIARSYGARVPVWLTEIGVSSTARLFSDRRPEVEQARALVKVLRYARRTRRIPLAIVHALRDGPDPVAGSAAAGFGVLHEDGSPKPAYCAIAALYGKSCS